VFVLDLACLYTLTWHRGYELRIAEGILIWRASLSVRRVPLATVCRMRPARWPGNVEVVELTGARPMIVAGGPTLPRFAEEMRAVRPGVPIIVAEPSPGTMRMRECRQRSWEKLPIPRLLQTARVLLAVESFAWLALAVWPDMIGCPAITVFTAILSPMGLATTLALGWWAQRQPDHPVDWRHDAVLSARFYALLLALVGLLFGAINLTTWATGACVATWPTVAPFNAAVIAVNAAIIPGLVFSRRWHPTSTGTPPAPAAGPAS
jgi:hypothetical protein